MHRRIYLITGILVFSAALLAAPALLRSSQVSGEPVTFSNSLQAGCYIAGPDDCRIHTDPFTIKTNGSKKLVAFTMMAIETGSGSEKPLYDFRTNDNEPSSHKGSMYTPSLVTQDFAVTCGKTYQLSLRGIDSSDASQQTYATTAAFTCPAQMP
jgi:hypothetical protein